MSLRNELILFRKKHTMKSLFLPERPTPVPFLKSHGDTRLEGEGNTRNEQTHSHCVKGKRTLEGKDWDLGKRNVFY